MVVVQFTQIPTQCENNEGEAERDQEICVRLSSFLRERMCLAVKNEVSSLLLTSSLDVVILPVHVE
jgi:hypothetical protein